MQSLLQHHGCLLALVVATILAGCSDSDRTDGKSKAKPKLTTTALYAASFFEMINPLAAEAGIRTAVTNEKSLGGGDTSMHHLRMQLRDTTPEKADKLLRLFREATEKTVRAEAKTLTSHFKEKTLPGVLVTEFHMEYESLAGAHGSLTATFHAARMFAKPDAPAGEIIEANEPGMGVLIVEQKEWVE